MRKVQKWFVKFTRVKNTGNICLYLLKYCKYTPQHGLKKQCLIIWGFWTLKTHQGSTEHVSEQNNNLFASGWGLVSFILLNLKKLIKWIRVNLDTDPQHAFLTFERWSGGSATCHGEFCEVFKPVLRVGLLKCDLWKTLVLDEVAYFEGDPALVLRNIYDNLCWHLNFKKYQWLSNRTTIQEIKKRKFICDLEPVCSPATLLEVC